MKAIGLNGSPRDLLPRGASAAADTPEGGSSFGEALKRQYGQPAAPAFARAPAPEPERTSSTRYASPAPRPPQDRVARSSSDHRTTAVEQARGQEKDDLPDPHDAHLPAPITEFLSEKDKSSRAEDAAGEGDGIAQEQDPEDEPRAPLSEASGIALHAGAGASGISLATPNPYPETSASGPAASQARADAMGRAGSQRTTARSEAFADTDAARAVSTSDAAEHMAGAAEPAEPRSAASVRDDAGRGPPGLAAEIGIAAARYAVSPRSDNAGAPRSGIRLSERSAALSLDRAQARQAADVVDDDRADAGPKAADRDDDPRTVSGQGLYRNGREDDRGADRRAITQTGTSASGANPAGSPSVATVPLAGAAPTSPTAALSEAIALEPSWRPETVAAMTQAHAYRSATAPTTLHVQLTPGSLGSIDASLKMVGVQLEIEIRVATDEAMAHLEGERQLIEKTLRSLGYDLSQLSIVQSRIASSPISSAGDAASAAAGGDASSQFQADANSSSGGNGSNDRHPHGAQDTTAVAGREAARIAGGDRGGMYI